MKLALDGQSKSLEPLNLQGIYKLQVELVNEYPCWNQLNGIYSIWFGKEYFGDYSLNGRERKSGRYWHIGPKEHLGDDTGDIMGPGGIDISPSRIKSGWRYYYDGWKEAAPSEIIFQDLSPSNFP